MSKAIIYARVSSSSQLEGNSIEAQISRLTQFCKEKGYEIADKYIDGGKSASIEEDKILINIKSSNINISLDLNKRPLFKKLLEEAGNHKFDAIVFWKWDRFSRNNIFSKLFQLYFKRFRIDLIPSDDSSDPLMIEIKNALSEEEIRKMKARVRQTRLYRFEQGMMVGRSPYGYEPVILKKKLVGFKPKLKEAEIVKKVFEYTLEGKDYKKICSQFKIAPQQYYNIIRNPVYAGFILFEGKIKEGTHPKIIDIETFKKLNPGFQNEKESAKT